MTRPDGAAVRRRYAREAPRYDRRWARYTEDTLRPTLRALPAGGALLDVGCGTGALLGEVLRREPGAALVGVDLSEQMLARARARLGPAVPLVQADASALPFPDGAFDRVVTTSALHHWTAPGAGLAEVARVTRPGGGLVVTDWCDDFLLPRLLNHALRARDAAHRRSFTSAGLAAMLAAAGYAVAGVERYRSGLRWGLMTVSARLR